MVSTAAGTSHSAYDFQPLRKLLEGLAEKGARLIVSFRNQSGRLC